MEADTNEREINLKLFNDEENAAIMNDKKIEWVF